MNNTNLNFDTPKTDPAEDLLGYAGFAKFVADNIVSNNSTSGLVISLNAPWGCGKTTCLKFIEHYLKNNKNIEILNFNPWGISDDKKDVILKFLHTLGIKLYAILYEIEKNRDKENHLPFNEKLSNKIFRFSRTRWYRKNELDAFNAIWKTFLGHCSPVALEQIEKLDTDLDIQKKKIDQLLKKTSKRLVIFIDDLDRLPKDEIRSVFRMIKAIADFDFITYLVAFDQEIVIDALNKDFCNNGTEYLKKIVQIPLTLPQIDNESINSILYPRLDDFIKSFNYNVVPEARERWFTYNKELIQPNIKNIRDINRLFNGLLCNYSQVASDVDLLDFLALEIIRLFKPSLYQEISNNLMFYAGKKQSIFKDEKTKYFESFSTKYPHYINIIKVMFPQTSQFLGGATYGPDWQNRWEQTKRICSDERVSIYFGLRLKDGQVSDLEVAQFLESLHSQDQLDSTLCEWSKEKLSSGRSKLFFWVPKLTSFAPQILNKRLEQFFITSIFKFKNSFNDIGDADYSQIISIDNDLRFMWLYNAILDGIKDEEHLYALLKNAVTSSDNLSSIAEFLLKHGISHGLFPDMKDQIDITITKEHYSELEKIFIKKIKVNYTNIHKYYNPVRLLQFMAVRTHKYYKQTMDYYIQTDANLILLLERLYVNVSSSEKGVFKSISTWSLHDYITDEGLINRLHKIVTKKTKLSLKAKKIIADIEEAQQYQKHIQ